jgi:hypothetical protein
MTYKNFQDQVYEDSDFFRAMRKVSLTMIAPIFSIYYVELELYDRSV